MQRLGNIHYGSQTREQHYHVPGTMAPGNALRQFKEEIIVSITLCSRAAIKGGLSWEMALTLSDFYIQRLETAATLPEVSSIHYQMRKDYIWRVHDLRHKGKLSSAVITCMDYVELHITDRLTVANVTNSIGFDLQRTGYVH